MAPLRRVNKYISAFVVPRVVYKSLTSGKIRYTRTADLASSQGGGNNRNSLPANRAGRLFIRQRPSNAHKGIRLGLDGGDPLDLAKVGEELGLQPADGLVEGSLVKGDDDLQVVAPAAHDPLHLPHPL